MKILVLNGPNLNMLGIREPEVYGKGKYHILVELLNEYAFKNKIDLEIYQSNHEGALVDRIQQAYEDEVDGIVINPAAYTHTSVAILDAIKAVNIPTIEVHISKLEQREDFRQISYVRAACIDCITGRGFQGYIDALDELIAYIKNK